MNQLLEEYKKLAKTCAETDYSDKGSVRRRNKAVARMYEIVEAIGSEQTDEIRQQFVELFDITDYDTHLWAAIHLLERLPMDSKTEEKALTIVRTAAKRNNTEAMGYRVWLEKWEGKNIV